MAEEQQSTASKPESRPPRPDSRDQRPRGRPGGGRRFFRRKKVDYFSVNKIDDINYKDVDVLKQFIGDRGKILPRRHTGLGAMHQRKLKIAIKRARNIALLPFAGGSDMLRSPKVEAKPAEAKAAETAAAETKAPETKATEAKADRLPKPRPPRPRPPKPRPPRRRQLSPLPRRPNRLNPKTTSLHRPKPAPRLIRRRGEEERWLKSF